MYRTYDSVAAATFAALTALLTAAALVATIGLFESLTARQIAAQAVPPAPAPVPAPPAAPPANPAATPQPAEAAGSQILTRGPVHEAFAEPTELNPVAPLIVPKKPPEPIDEMPPDMQPEGYNVVWIPGYWAWDDSGKDFIWISGVWRDSAPGQVWVSGYWTPTQGGYQWVPGFWTAGNQNEMGYVPQPPQSEEKGPTTAAPSPNDFWVPGYFHYTGSGFAWRGGYWTAAQSGWIWEPAHYLWTPSGYLFVGGYWDYALAQRGIPFAPVSFSGVLVQRALSYKNGWYGSG